MENPTMGVLLALTLTGVLCLCGLGLIHKINLLDARISNLESGLFTKTVAIKGGEYCHWTFTGEMKSEFVICPEGNER